MISQNQINDNEDIDDELGFRFDETLKKVFAPDEVVLMSCAVDKFNKHLKKQERNLLITTKAIYNINRNDLLANFISFFNAEYAIRRRIDITKLAGITVSEFSEEFVIHVQDEYDYRYGCLEKRNEILLVILRAYCMNVQDRRLAFYFKDEIDLVDFTTTEDDFQEGANKMPRDDPTLVDEDALLQRLGKF